MYGLVSEWVHVCVGVCMLVSVALCLVGTIRSYIEMLPNHNIFISLNHSGSILRNACVACETTMCDYQESVTTRQMDRQMQNKVIPMCHYASQATQKMKENGRGKSRTLC